MKTSFGLILGLIVSTSLLADEAVTPAANPAPPPATANADIGNLPPVTNEPAPAMAQPETMAAKPAAAKPSKPKHDPKKSTARKSNIAAAELRTVPLVPGPAMVVAHRVNVRGKPTLRSVVLTQMTNGATVNVIEEIHLNHSGPTEPSAWAKISLPPGAKVWVHGHFINSDTKKVIPKLLNIRGGPGENYPILGRLHQGETITEIKTDFPWIEIEPPTNAYAFMAAAFLQQEAVVPTNEVAEVAPAETPVATPTPVEENTNVIAAASGLPEMTNAPTPPEAEPTNELAEAEAPETPAGPPPSPVVLREGVVRSTVSIQAPTAYELFSPDTGHTIDYLYTTSTNLDLSRYKGLQIIVTGKEGLDERWKKTPVLTIQRIQVID